MYQSNSLYIKNMSVNIDRIIEWNSKRFTQWYDHELASNLMVEELNELNVAADWVQILDAVGDICFVFVGNLWKMRIDKEHILQWFVKVKPKENIYRTNELSDTYIVSLSETYNFHPYNFLQLKLSSHALFTIGFQHLQTLGMSEAFSDIVSIVCDSNETKSLPDTLLDKSVKANINKGKNYIPPTAELIKLLHRVKSHDNQ